MRYGSGGQGKDSGNELNVENKKTGDTQTSCRWRKKTVRGIERLGEARKKQIDGKESKLQTPPKTTI